MSEIALDQPKPLERDFNPWTAVIFICLVVLAALFLTPTVGVLLSSLKTTQEISLGRLWAPPSSLFLDNFVQILSSPAVHTYLLNTVLVTVPANPLVAALPTDRMPAFIAPDDWTAWLEGDGAAARACLKTVDGARWTMRPEERAAARRRAPVVADPGGLF